MKLTTIRYQGDETAAISIGEKIISVQIINRIENKRWSSNLLDILQKGQLDEIHDWYLHTGKDRLLDFPTIQGDYAPLYRNPAKILGVGMNYIEKAEELSVNPPEEAPIFFMKPITSLIGPGEPIQLTPLSKRVSAEAELGIIIKKKAKNIKESDFLDVIAGFTNTLDMTAQDIHAKNPRYLQFSKSFDSFFSFGPHLITADEFSDLQNNTIETCLNQQVIHHNKIHRMIYSLPYIVSHFSKIMTLLPGDIIMTGTPGSTVICDGDIAECRINGMPSLLNPVTK